MFRATTEAVLLLVAASLPADKKTLRKSFINAGKCAFNVLVKPSELNMMCSGESSLNVNKPATASIEDSAGWLEIEVI